MAFAVMDNTKSTCEYLKLTVADVSRIASSCPNVRGIISDEAL